VFIKAVVVETFDQGGSFGQREKVDWRARFGLHEWQQCKIGSNRGIVLKPRLLLPQDQAHASECDARSPVRRFPPPWSVEELDTCLVVRDATGQALS
jgi:hypothetical protein